MTVSEYEPIPLPDYDELPVEDMCRRASTFLELVRRRHTVRDFSPRAAPREIIETCLQAAATAPNGANHQPWHFAVVSDADIKHRIRLGAEEEERAFYAGRAGEEWLGALRPLGTSPEKPFLDVAPWLIVVFGERRSRSADGVVRKNYYVPESVSIAVGFLLLGLHSAGLATLTHTPSPMGFLNEICDRPISDKPYFLIATGYPADDATIPRHATEKRPMSEIVSWI
ncbi:MAG: nitroreductase family protein [Pseudomonadota bacterium]